MKLNLQPIRISLSVMLMAILAQAFALAAILFLTGCAAFGGGEPMTQIPTKDLQAAEVTLAYHFGRVEVWAEQKCAAGGAHDRRMQTRSDRERATEAHLRRPERQGGERPAARPLAVSPDARGAAAAAAGVMSACPGCGLIGVDTSLAPCPACGFTLWGSVSP